MEAIKQNEKVMRTLLSAEQSSASHEQENKLEYLNVSSSIVNSNDSFSLHSSNAVFSSPYARPSSSFSNKKRKGEGEDGGYEFLQLDVYLNEKEIRLRKKIRAFMEEKIKNLVIPLYEKADFSPKLIELAKSLGPGGMQINDYGCAGMNNMEALVTTIEMCRVDASFATFYLVHSGLAMKSIAIAGTNEQKQHWLPMMARYEKIGAFGLTEPDIGSDANAIQTTARKVKDGWILNGRKRWIGNATFADLVIIWAKNESTNDITGFIVEKGTKGFSTFKIENKISLRIVQNADIILKDCFVPDSNKFKANTFREGVQLVLQSSRGLTAACACGCILGAYDSAFKYCMERKQFNKSIAAFQLVQERLMRTLGQVQACILTVFHLGRLLERGRATMAHITLTKAMCSKLARQGVALCREIVGGNGICLDYDVAKHFVDAEGIYTYEGSYDMNILIAGRAVTGLNSLL